MSMLAGAMLGQYQLIEVLGRGGMATVYRARQAALGRDVAIKVLHNYLDAQAATRFEREARAVARLQHPNILPIYDYGEQDGRRYFVTQLIEGGRTLANLIAERRLAPVEAIGLAALVLDALEYAHRQGIIHRDIKPANVLLPRPDWPLLGDFGIAELLSATTQLTPIGQIIGTADYLAPERAADRPGDVRADIYAMGVVLYEMLTGQLPFQGDSAIAVLLQHVQAQPPSPRALVPSLPVALEQAVLRALAKEPAERFGSAAEMGAALRQIARDLERTEPALDELDAFLPPPRPVPATSAHDSFETQPAAPRSVPLTPVTQVVLPAVQSSSEAPRQSSRRAGWKLWLACALGLGLLAVLGLRFLRPAVPLAADGAALVPGGPALRLDDQLWSDGYGGQSGARSYGGRTAVWVYGQGTDFNSMRVGFLVEGRARGRAVLRVEGMDAEGPAKAEISITINGQEIYRGANPLPDDDFDLNTGTWASYDWEFDAGLLRDGQNELRIVNLSPGAFSQPPFFMLDYGEVVVLANG